MKDEKKDEQPVKSTVAFPHDLWLRAKHKALEERCDFRQLVIEGLELRLAKKNKRGGDRS